MKRDIDLIREILLKTEELPFWSDKSTLHRMTRDSEGWWDIAHYLQITGHTAEKISYHVKIMQEVGLIEAIDRRANDRVSSARPSRVYIPTGLTWEGHEFLEAIRDEKRWEKVKAEIAKGGGFVYEVVKSIAIDFLEEEINPNRVKSLKKQLMQRYNNLNALEEQGAKYVAEHAPVELQNKIKDEKDAISNLEEKLKLLTG